MGGICVHQSTQTFPIGNINNLCSAKQLSKLSSEESYTTKSSSISDLEREVLKEGRKKIDDASILHSRLQRLEKLEKHMRATGICLLWR
jgi:hypothetical protein